MYRRKLNTAEFINKAKAVHGDKYDYSPTEYVHSQTKVEITCPRHGSFWQTPNNHLKGHGCTVCGATPMPTTAEFINKAKAVHGDKYDYSRTEYANAKTKLEIVCSKHGSFLQRPAHHLNGHGCPVCAGLAVPTTAEFVDKAKAVHGDKYDYSQVEYGNNVTKVEIVCSKHGSFWQTPNNHINGQGCPACGSRALCENIVGEILHRHYPDVVRQYPIKGSEFNMRADFYLPSIDTIVEWDGTQHFAPVEAWGGLEAFERQQLRDADLRAYCAETCMKLCVIDARPYSPVRNPPTEDVILAAIQAIQDVQQ